MNIYHSDQRLLIFQMKMVIKKEKWNEIDIKYFVAT